MHWVFGSLNVDLVVQMERFPRAGETLTGTEFSTFLGGKGGNQAMALARLGGAPRVVGHVGDDSFGTRYRDALSGAGADVSRVTAVAGIATGTALIEVEASGQNRIVIVPGANGTFPTGQIDRELTGLADGDTLLLQLEIPHEVVWEAAAYARTVGASAILDPAPAAPLPSELYKNLEWITPNETEASTLTGIDTTTDDGLTRAARELHARGAANVVVKAGARGALCLGRRFTEPIRVPGYPVEVVDTTAAGDSFNGGLAWALGRGVPPIEAVRTANAVAALSVTGLGAQTAMPDEASLTEFLASYQTTGGTQ